MVFEKPRRAYDHTDGPGTVDTFEELGVSPRLRFYGFFFNNQKTLDKGL